MKICAIYVQFYCILLYLEKEHFLKMFHVFMCFPPPARNELSDDSAVQYLVNKEKEHHITVVENILGVLKLHIGKFHDLLLKPPEMSPMLLEANVSILPAFGNTRLQICCLFTVLIETQDSDIINA